MNKDEPINKQISDAAGELIGKWFNETVGLFFEGSDKLDGTGRVTIGDINLLLHGEARYKLSVIDNKPCIQLILKEGEQIRNYKIIDLKYNGHGVLIVEAPEGNKVSLFK